MGSSRIVRPDAWDGTEQWPSPQFVLGDYLEQLGVAQPRRVAGALLRDFGSISSILSASWWQLRRSVGTRLANAIRASRNLMRSALVESVTKGPVISNRREVVELLRLHLGSLRRERLIAVYLDSGLHLLRIERIADGSVRNVPFDIPRMIHVGLDVGAACFLVVHNHPGGDPTPSDLDRRKSSQLRRIAADLDMVLVDSLIIADGEARSAFLD